MQFIYVLTSWEGSAANSRVLHDAMSQQNGLKIPHGKRITIKNGTPFFNITL